MLVHQRVSAISYDYSTAILLAGDVHHHHRQHFVCWSLTIITVTQIRSRSAGIMIDVCQAAVGMRRCVRQFGPWKALGGRLRWSVCPNCHFLRENDDQPSLTIKFGSPFCNFQRILPGWAIPSHGKSWPKQPSGLQRQRLEANERLRSWWREMASALVGTRLGCRPSRGPGNDDFFLGRDMIPKRPGLLENGSDM